ncbi:MAG: glyoxylate/hydroxypyruvate reductase A [Proteobacteria bacterium]|nr:MAG: glyoxylate/hydroxypyruvate reductase A [Pseudomonadota bacterium]
MSGAEGYNRTMSVLYIGYEENDPTWMREIRAADPRIDLRTPADVVDRERVRYAVVGRTRPGDLEGYPNLEAILSLWAGVEHLLGDETVPRDVPIVRMAEPSLTRGMVEYVCCHALNILLRTDRYADGGWSHPQKRVPRFAPDIAVGVMGVGVLGEACAAALSRLGFAVNGWSRCAKKLDGVSMFAGRAELAPFLGASDIVVLLLPHTPDTAGVLDREALAHLPAGASVVNAGRGELIDDDALLEALDADRLDRAVLDVFRTEPLPRDHRFWHHPRVTVTPHVASVTNPATAAPVLIDTLNRLQRGEPVWPLVDRTRGY